MSHCENIENKILHLAKRIYIPKPNRKNNDTYGKFPFVSVYILVGMGMKMKIHVNSLDVDS